MADSPEEERQLELDARAYHAEVAAHHLALAQNIATNGRLFSIMVAAAAIAGGHPALAVLAALPVGAACLVDQLTNAAAKSFYSAATYLLAVCVALTVLVAVW